MTLKSRDKKTIAIGSVVVSLILLITYVILPLGRVWRSLGARCAPRLREVRGYFDQADRKKALLARRDALAALFGSVLGPEAYPAAKPDEDSKKDSSKEKTDKSPKTKTSSSPSEKNGKGDEKKKADDKAQDSPADAKKEPSPKTDEKPQPPPKTDEKAQPVPKADAEAGKENDQASPEDKAASTSAPKEPDKNAKKDDEKQDVKAEKKEDLEKEKPEKEEPKKEEPKLVGISLAAHLERVAQKASVNIKQITQRKPTQAYRGRDCIQAVGAQISLEADSDAFLKLIHGLEKGERLVRIEHAEIRRDAKNAKTLRVTLRVVGYETVAR